jgi:hypothetical protein
MSDRSRKPPRSTRGKDQPKRVDTTTRELLADNPPAWVAYMRLHAGGLMQVMDSNVASTAAEIDQVYRVAKPRPHLIHIEVQARWDKTLARRMWRYNALLDLKYDLRVRSVALLLRPTADSKQMTGVLELRLPDGDRVVEFHYSVVRAWQQPVAPLLRGPLATLPMATLADVPVADLPDILRQIDSRFMAETSPEIAAIMMVRTLFLAGMRMDPEHLKVLKRGLRTMNILKESSFSRPYFEEGEKVGEKVGEKRGQIAEAKKIVIDLGQTRFGRLSKATRAAIKSIDDLERLEALIKKILKVASWTELLTDAE